MKTYSQLSFNHQAQIQMAVRGGIKGPLEEWPTLRAALLELGHDFPLDTPVNPPALSGRSTEKLTDR